jgi:hypothetical protein
MTLSRFEANIDSQCTIFKIRLNIIPALLSGLGTQRNGFLIFHYIRQAQTNTRTIEASSIFILLIRLSGSFSGHSLHDLLPPINPIPAPLLY